MCIVCRACVCSCALRSISSIGKRHCTFHSGKGSRKHASNCGVRDKSPIEKSLKSSRTTSNLLFSRKQKSVGPIAELRITSVRTLLDVVECCQSQIYSCDIYSEKSPLSSSLPETKQRCWNAMRLPQPLSVVSLVPMWSSSLCLGTLDTKSVRPAARG